MNPNIDSKVVNVAIEIADKGAALSDLIASSNTEEFKNNPGKTASGESVEQIVEKQFGEKVGEFWGKSLSAAIGVDDFKNTSLNNYHLALQEISALTDTLSATLKTNAEAFLVRAKESKPKLDELVSRVKTYDKAGTEFLGKMDKCAEAVKKASVAARISI